MPTSNESLARAEICRIGRSLFERAYVHATAGNISVRLAPEDGGGYLITPTDACLGFLAPEQLAHVNEEGQQTGGGRASKTLALHRRIYAATNARCVIHTHSSHCVGLTLGAALQPAPLGPELLPALTPYFLMKVGHVPVIAYRRPGDPAAADAVAEAIAAYAAAGLKLRAVMLERLGPNVWHDSPAAAMATLEELEETAKLWATHRDAAPLSEVQIAELRESFGASW
jgi:ribulose-5-phosphate 4-epimerase/fuculose-1-phosphate aldolase